MENTNQINNIGSCAVRIADSSGSILYGSGVLYLGGYNNYVMIFTAAHVIDKVWSVSKDEYKTIKLSMSDNENTEHSLSINSKVVNNVKKTLEIGDIYKHKDYDNQKYINDAAIICVQKEVWMEHLNSFHIGKSERSEVQMGYGFPAAADKEAINGSNDGLAGKLVLECKVNNVLNNNRYVFAYDKNVQDPDISREDIMSGYSGTGLFAYRNNRYIFCGIVSSEYGDESVGNISYASSAILFSEIMEQNDITINLPDSFESSKNSILKEYDSGYEDEKDIIDYYANKLIYKGLIPECLYEDNYTGLNCIYDRRFCHEFWKGQLKKSIVLALAKSVQIKDMKHPVIDMPASCQCEKVNIKFLCTEDNISNTITNLIKHDYFSKGNIEDNTIFIWNNHLNNNYKIREYSRKKFRNVLVDIVKSERCNYTTDKISNKLSSIITDSADYIGFDIIQGSIKKCNFALILVDEMMKIIDNSSLNKSNPFEVESEIQKKFDDQLSKIWEV